MRKDAFTFVQACDKCRRFANLSQIPTEELTPITSPWPFTQWGIDIVGPLPIGRKHMKFLVVVIDYFTKWVETEPLTKITEKNVQNFVWKNIICRFEVSNVIISNNGHQFDSSSFRSFCSGLEIKNHYTSLGYPQSNGQVEVTNHTLLKIIKVRIKGAKGA